MRLNRPVKNIITPSGLLGAIIYINVAMFIISLIYSGKNIVMSLNPFYALTPSTDVLILLGASGRLPIDRFGTWWSLIAANWLHGGLLHILFNMMAVKTVAPLVLKDFGLYRMFSIYTLAGAAGFLLSYAGNVHLTIGASSGLCGLIGAALYFGKSRGGQWGERVYKQTSGWVVSLIIIGFLIPNINNWGHAGGLFAGIVLGRLMAYNEKRNETFFDKLLAIGLFGITLWILTTAVIRAFLFIYG